MKRKKVLITIIVITVVILLLILYHNRGESYQSLSVTKTKWLEILSNKRYSNDLKLNRISFNDYDLIIDYSTDTIYYSVINDSDKKYNPTVRYSVSEIGFSLAVLENNLNNQNNELQIMLYNNEYYHIYNLVCTRFPILNISYSNADYNARNIPIDVYLFDNLGFAPNRVFRSKGNLNILNNSEYRFGLYTVTPGKNRREFKISILNLDPHDEYILTPADDYENGGVNGKRTSQKVELFINNKYVGLYSLKTRQNDLMDKPNNNFGNE